MLLRPCLIEALSDADHRVRREAVISLAGIGNLAALKALRPLLSDREKTVQIETAKAMKRLGDDSGLKTLEAFLQDEDWGVRLRALEALGDVVTEISVFEKTLGDPHVKVRVTASKIILRGGMQQE